MDTLDEPELKINKITTTHIVSTMVCVTCGNKKAFPDGFPTLIYAECWRCAWDNHDRKEHPPKWRERRKMKKELKKKLKAELIKERQDARNP